MRNLRGAAFVTIFGIVLPAHAKWLEVDLDAVGAMETIEQEYPERHKQILAEIAKAQTIHVDPTPTIQNLATRLDDSRLKGTGEVMTSHPAKRRFTILIDGVLYRGTVHMTKDPGKLEKVK
jgi:hypothetical protein